MHVPSFRLCTIDPPHQGPFRCHHDTVAFPTSYPPCDDERNQRENSYDVPFTMSGQIQCPRRELALRPSILYNAHNVARDIGKSGTRGISTRLRTAWTRCRAFVARLCFVGGACGRSEGRGSSWQYFYSTNLGQSVQLVLGRDQSEGTFSPFHTYGHLGDPQADQ